MNAEPAPAPAPTVSSTVHDSWTVEASPALALVAEIRAASTAGSGPERARSAWPVGRGPNSDLPDVLG